MADYRCKGVLTLPNSQHSVNRHVLTRHTPCSLPLFADGQSEDVPVGGPVHAVRVQHLAAS